jgi:hypothetical protein
MFFFSSFYYLDFQVTCIVPYRCINGIPETGGLLWLKHAVKLHFDDTSSKFRLKHKNFKKLLHGVLFLQYGITTHVTSKEISQSEKASF